MNELNERRQPIPFVFISFLATYVIVGFLLRFVLIATSPADASYTVGEILRSVSVGCLSDLGMGVLLCIPMAIIAPGLNTWKYDKPWSYCFGVLWWVAFVYAWMPFSVFHQYGGGAPLVADTLWLEGYQLYDSLASARHPIGVAAHIGVCPMDGLYIPLTLRRCR